MYIIVFGTRKVNYDKNRKGCFVFVHNAIAEIEDGFVKVNEKLVAFSALVSYTER